MKYNFSWEHFPVTFLKKILMDPHTKVIYRPKFDTEHSEDLIPNMNAICKYPDDSFVRKYRKIIETFFLADSTHIINVAKHLQHVHNSGITVEEPEILLPKLQGKRMTETLCNAYLTELRMTGRHIYVDDESLFQTPKVIDLIQSRSDKITLYPYQKKAVEALHQYYVEEDGQSGILSLPTGGGKTRTSVYFLINDIISHGYQVVWMAHRSMLLDQAAEQFYKFASVIKDANPDMEEFRMVCISGKHSSVRSLTPKDNLIITSVQSMCNNTIYLKPVLGEKIIIIVDEAHHTIAPSYMRIIRDIRKICPHAKLLGLTATPIRMNENESKRLMNIFDNKIIYSVDMDQLIAKGTLATPKPILVKTNFDIEAIIDINERAYIKKWKEMSDSLVEKVARTNERNELIVNEYVNHKDVYGKTIIYALNGIHCDSLNEMFLDRGIRSGYVYSTKGSIENQRIIERFKDNTREDGIDVLININILTEGSDIPDIQTVFLTRPTMSDVLLMQMVGRGMRGKDCGGTEILNIVDFCDKWDSIQGWMKPNFLVGNFEPVEEQDYEYKKIELIPVGMIRDIVKRITYNGAKVITRAVALPLGWFDVKDNEGNDSKILVFESQKEGYDKMSADLQNIIVNTDMTARQAVMRYFASFGILPNDDDMENLLFFIQQEQQFPELHLFEERKIIDPAEISKKIKNEDLSYSAILCLIKDTYMQNKDLIESIYNDCEYYQKRILEYLTFPKGIVPIGTVIEEVDKSVYMLSEKPFSRSLDDMLDEVIQEQGEHFAQPFERPEIVWTDHQVRGFYGEYSHDYNLIRINSLLNAANVQEEVMKFLIYHECLHQEFVGHPKAFREKEHLYPDFQKYEYYLDETLRDFDHESAM